MGKKRGADVTTTVAEALRLTSRQWAFVAAYATNGQNGTAAAKSAGYSGDENALAAAASRMLRLPKIRKALDQLVGKAVARVEQGTIATLAECLQFLTAVKNARAADYLKRGRGGAMKLDQAKLAAAPAGLFRITPKGLEQESAKDAARELIRHYHAIEGEEKLGDLAEALKMLPTETIATIARAMLAGRQMKAIDVTARVQ